MKTFATKLKAYSLRIIVFSLFAVTLIGLSNYAVSNSGGKTGQSTAGCTCHCNSSDNSTTVVISTSATVFEAGQTYNFTITVSSSNGGATKGGVNIAAATGTLTAGSNGLQKIGAELTHSSPKNLNASWDFTYTVPSSGTSATITAAGNAVDGTGDDDGNCTDNWNTTSYTINIAQRDVALTRTTIPFGARKVGSSAVSDTLRIVSTGAASLTVSSSSMKNSTQFSASPSGTNRSIAGGQEEVNTITFNPTTRGTFVDTFVVNNNSSVAANQRKTVVVTGTAIQAIFNGGTSLGFGNVDINTTKDLVYTIENTGDDTLFLNSTTPASITGNAFTIFTPPSSTTIAPGGSTNLTVRFSPLAKQAYTGSLTFTTLGGIGSPTVALTGNGAAPQIQVPNFLDAGSTKVNVQTFATLNITNSGNSPLQITSVTLSGPSVARFGITGSTNFTIAAGQSQPVSISYTPNAEKRDTAQITVSCNDAQSPTKIIALFGKGVLPKMSVAPDSVDFGDVRIGASLTKNSIVITNPGEVSLAIGTVTVSGAGFTLENKPNQIQAGSTGQVSVKYTPTTEGASTGMVVINSEAPATPSDTVYIKGKGTKSQIAAPTSINFGSIRVNQFKDSVFTVENLGSAPVTIRKYALTDPDNGFRINDSSKHSLPAKSSITVSVRFRPTVEKNYNGALVITTDEAANNTITVNLSGKGIDSKLIVEPNSLGFGEIDTMKTSAPQSFTIKNGGTAPTTINSIVKTGSTTFSMNVDKSTPFSLAPDSIAIVTVTFAPTLVQAESGTITVTASEGSPIEVVLSGTGKEVPIVSVPERPNFRFTMSISPNPAREYATLSLTSERAATINVVIIDMNGKTAINLSNERVIEGKNSINVITSGLAQGMYLVRIYENGALLDEENMAIIR
jgi:hypothetical protein